MATWQVQEAKTNLSVVIDRANTEGPQTITRRGNARAMVLSIEDYAAMLQTEPSPEFIDFMLTGPTYSDVNNYLAQLKDAGREIDVD